MRLPLLVFHIATGVLGGIQEAIGTRASAGGVPVFMGIFMSSVILLAGLGDLRMLVRGISGRRRIAQHLWHMCLGGLLPQVPSSWGSNRYFLHLGVVGTKRAIPATLSVFIESRSQFSIAEKCNRSGTAPSY